MTRFLGLPFVLALTLGVALPARAQEDPRKAAGAHYQKGLELANRADYKAALAEFNAAYAASPNFAVLYNIGQAEVAIGRPRQAIVSLRRYLRDGGEQVPANRRQQVEEQLKALESAFAYLTVVTKPEGATVTVDGGELARTPLSEPLRLNPGPHIVGVSMAGKSSETRQLTLGEGQAQTLSFELFEAPMAPSTAPAPAVETPPPPSEPRPVPPAPAADKSSFPTGYVLLGAGVVTGGVAIAHYIWNAGRVRDFRNNEAALQTDTSPGRRQRLLENNHLADSIDAASVVTVILGVGAGALAAGGAATLTWSGTW